MSASPRILVAGIGNVFFGDDAFGVQTVRRLARRNLPEGVRVVDFGIRGIDLGYRLLEDHDAVILVDAFASGRPAGTLTVLEPAVRARADAAEELPGAHGMDPMAVLRWVASMEGRTDHVRLVGCEPETVEMDGNGRMDLTPRVADAVDRAVDLIQSLIDDFRRNREWGGRSA